MRVGDRVFLSGGHEIPPEWLSGADGYYGTIEKFIPGQNDSPAAVVRFEHSVATRWVTGDYAVLELRFEGATWTGKKRIVHVELCDFVPDDIRWQDRRQGKWVESHATVTLAS